MMCNAASGRYRKVERTGGAKHGVGRVDLVENRLVGMKSHGVYETPGGTILYKAHQALESLCLDRDTLHFKEQVAVRYAELVYFGKWYTSLREAMQAFIDKTQEPVTGWVKVKLYKGNVITDRPFQPAQPLPRRFRHFRQGRRVRSVGRGGLSSPCLACK
jgi:argininosuccinate synthase